MVAADTCTISRAALADLDALAPLFDAYRVFYGRPSDPAMARAFLTSGWPGVNR